MCRNEELEIFLKRVEGYDSQRREANFTSENNRGKYSQESIERARQLLKDGVSIIDGPTTSTTLGASELAYRSAYNYERTFSPKRLTSEEKTYIVSEEDYILLQRLKAKEKSPPPLPGRERVREQRLEALLIEEKPPALPSRRYYNSNLDVSGMDKQEISNDMVKNRRNGKPPIPPKSKTRLRTLDTKADVESGGNGESLAPPLQSHRSNQTEKSGLGKTVRNKPELKSSPRKFNLNAELELSKEATIFGSSKPLVFNSSRGNFLDSIQGSQQETPKELTTTLESSKLPGPNSSQTNFLDSVQGSQQTPKGMTTTPGSSKPLIPNYSHVDFLDSVQGNHQETPKETTTMLLSIRPLLPKPSHVDFLDSVQGSQHETATKTTQFNAIPQNKTKKEGIHPTAASVPPIKPAKPADLSKANSLPNTDPESFISSALKTSPHSSTYDVNRTNFMIPSKPSSESFLNSALKSSPLTKGAPATKFAAPIKPMSSKPAPLQRPQPERPTKPVELAHLKPTLKQEKSKPQVPPKKSEIIIPKLRHVNSSRSSVKNSASLNTDFANSLKKVDLPKRPEESANLPEALTRLSCLSKPPPSPKRQDDVPEALTKLGHLSKPASSPKRQNEMPEALSHLEKLNKVSKQPPVPVRKISMAEALKKAQELKIQKQANQKIKHEPEQPRDMKSELGAVLMAQKLRSSKTYFTEPSSVGFASSNSSTTSLDHTQSTPPTPTGPDDTKLKTLPNFNKTRTRGPKRKPPSAFTKSK